MKITEDKIAQLVTKEALKNAKSLYKSGAIIFSYINNDGYSVITVKDKNKVLHEINIKNNNTVLSILSKKNCSVHELVAFLHYIKFNSNNENTDFLEATTVKSSKKPINLEPEDSSTTVAKLIINTKIGLPNTSSTWECCNISVDIIYKSRRYIGNHNKLRQLRFDENKLSTYKIADFSHQDRQLIRFISQYAEPDGSGYSLRSEIISEMFHSLIGYTDFYSSNQQIVIHRETAELVGVVSNIDSNLINPCLLINGKKLHLKQFKIIVGRSGIWVGIEGEYWWIPATSDIIWLRKFLLTPTMLFNSKAQLTNMPIRLISSHTSNCLNEKKCSVCYYIDFTNSKDLQLQLKYNYGNQELHSDSHRIAEGANSYWKRDKLFENSIEEEVLRTGFQIETLNHGFGYSLTDLESIGKFLDYTLPGFNTNSKAVYLSYSASKQLSMISDLQLNCHSPIENDNNYRLKYELSNNLDATTTWKELVKHVNVNRRYIFLNNGNMSRINDDLFNLISVFKRIITIDKGGNKYINIPKGSILYWIKSACNIPKAIPQKWKHFNIAPKETVKKTISNTSQPDNFCGELRKYQLKSIEWMTEMSNNGFNIILADEMGLGKTIQALAFISRYLQNKHDSFPCMVVCPTSLVENWLTEANKFVPHLKVLLIHGTGRDDALKQFNDYDLIITSYALIKKDIDYYNNACFEILILDEAQHIKNPATINAKVCKLLHAKHRIVLTGTPLENSPSDIWSIFDFLNPGMLGSRDSFNNTYGKIEFNCDKQKELAEIIHPFILRRYKKDVEKLPEKLEQTLFCNMLPKQRKIYDDILRDSKDKYQSLFNGKSTRFDILTSLLRLRQLCCHPQLLPEIYHKGEESSGKTDLLKELLLQTIDSGHRTLIFSQFTSLLAILKKWLNEHNIMYEYLDGQTKNRLAKVNRFNNNKDISLFLLSLKAGGTGLNLTGADTVIIYDPWWNPSVQAQAEDRTHRIGQKKQVTSIKLVMKDSIEEKIIELQQRKQGLFNGIIENSSSFSKLSMKDISYLLNG